MANFGLYGQDAPTFPPDMPSFVPAAPPKWAGDGNTGPQPQKAANANDGGALWWDHDDPGQNGHGGYAGAGGAFGLGGFNGGDTPAGVRFTITQTINGSFTIELHGGRGQPGGPGGQGAAGGEGQDGGDSDDEQPAGLGGQGGNGGPGGPGGAGGKGGTINEFDLVIGVPIDVSQVSVTYDQGRGGTPGVGGIPGDGGLGGIAGSGGPRQVSGFQGPGGPNGAFGKDGYVNDLRVIV